MPEQQGKIAGKKAAKPSLVPQPHGGALYSGGVPGHNGRNAGRPPSALRERLRGSLEDRVAVLEEIADDRVAVLEEIADDPESQPSDRIRSIDVLAKYGLGTVREVTVDQVRGRLRQTLAIIRAELPSLEAERLIERLQEVWI
jgi:hypothetical protein